MVKFTRRKNRRKGGKRRTRTKRGGQAEDCYDEDNKDTYYSSSCYIDREEDCLGKLKKAGEDEKKLRQVSKKRKTQIEAMQKKLAMTGEMMDKCAKTEYDLTQCEKGKGSANATANKSEGEGETETFSLKKGDSGFVDLYLNGFDHHGKKVSDKKMMDNIFDKIHTMAMNKAGKGGIDNLYDGYNYVAMLKEMVVPGMRPEITMAEKLKFVPAFDESCDKTGTKTNWSWEYHLNMTNVKRGSTYNPENGCDIKKVLTLYKETLKNSPFQNAKIIQPINIPQHSMCGIFEKSGNEVVFYFADPNGFRDTGIPDSDFGKITLTNKYALYTECKNAGIKWGGDLLCDLSPQTVGLQFIDSGGFCGGFTIFLSFLFLINPDKSCKDMFNYIDMREKQWQNNSKHDWVKMGKLMHEGFGTNTKEDLYWEHALGPSKDIHRYVDGGKSVFEIYVAGLASSAKNGNLNVKGQNITPDVLRQDMIKNLKDEMLLDWYECHIVMFLIYLEEYCTRYCPLVLYGKNRWTEVGDVLSAPGPYYSYVTPKCDKNFKDNANKQI